MTIENPRYDDERDAIVQAAALLFQNEVMSHSGHANLSARVSNDSMLLTIEGHVRGLRNEGIALVGLDGSVIDGKLDPANAEIVTMHSEVYKIRPDVHGIIHTHSPSLLSFAFAHAELPCRYEAMLRFEQAVAVPVVPWAPRGTERSVGAIIDVLRDNPNTKAVLLANHGVLVFGKSPRDTALTLTVLEEAAAAELDAATLSGAKNFPAGALDQVLAGISRFS